MGALAYIYSLANIRRNELVLDCFLAACWMISTVTVPAYVLG